jgi:hypothetical protein
MTKIINNTGIALKAAEKETIESMARYHDVTGSIYVRIENSVICAFDQCHRYICGLTPRLIENVKLANTHNTY